MSERIYQITASHFCAGLTINDRGQVTHAAPIVAYMHGWTSRRVQTYVHKKAWRIVEVEPVQYGKPPTYTKYRADGWPLCPRCGQDELWACLPKCSEAEMQATPLSKWIEHIQYCYACGWRPPHTSQPAAANNQS